MSFKRSFFPQESSEESTAAGYRPNTHVEGHAFTMGEGDEEIRVLPNHKESEGEVEDIKEDANKRVNNDYSLVSGKQGDENKILIRQLI